MPRRGFAKDIVTGITCRFARASLFAAARTGMANANPASERAVGTLRLAVLSSTGQGGGGRPGRHDAATVRGGDTVMHQRKVNDMRKIAKTPCDVN